MAILPLVLLPLLLLLLSALLLARALRAHRTSKLPLPPGPKGSPIVGNLLQLGPKPHQTLYNLSKAHGPLIHLRFGFVDMIVVNSAATAAKILRNDANVCSRPTSTSVKHIAYNHQDLIFAHYGARWRMLRKICALQLFSPKAMEDLAPVRADEVGRFVRELAAAEVEEKFVNLSDGISACAADALSRVVVGRRVFGDGEESREFKEMVVEMMNLSTAFNINDFVPGLGWLDLQGLVGKMKKLHRKFDEFLDRVIEDHQVRLTETGKTIASAGGGRGRHNDLLSVLIEAKEDANGDGIALTDADIKPLLQNMFTAGTDTSSNTIEFAIAELIRHPDLLARAQQELDHVVGRRRLVAETDLPNLPFFQAVIKETFRHHPAAPLSLPRIISQDFEIDGYLIPKGATLLVNIWAIGRDPMAWPDETLAFRPDRFLPGGRHEGIDVKGNDFELIPFGGGRRICAGMNLGMRMVQFMAATLVHSFDWKLPEGQLPEKLDMDLSFGLTLHRTTPLMIRPVPRLDPKAYL
ncbi:flavonoid 3'-monooxygenase isoform X2 [Dendrobium catenatum]|uniref:flavonoid 3'-monooxygenase isoform X2 n=1 Tax=Dendrobium catenatum TaxID=906689 RepID=UPI0009F37670|nr:flavonoid 3'-monooxygenase isoform X2 [Dendrobium catenatum]